MDPDVKDRLVRFFDARLHGLLDAREELERRLRSVNMEAEDLLAARFALTECVPSDVLEETEEQPVRH